MTQAAASEQHVVYTRRGRRSTGPRRSLLEHRELTFQLVRRELGRRYRGRFLGLFWMVLQPLLLLGLYSFVFGVVFGARWPGFESLGTLGFALVVFAGLIPFGVFAEVVNASPRLILSNRALLKNVDFPAEVLPVVALLCAGVQAVASLAILLVGLAIFGPGIPASAGLLPIVWLPLALFSLGACFLLSAIGAFLRDLEGVVGLAVTGLLFGSAIFYPLSRVPESARAFLEWLPTSYFVESTRAVLLRGDWQPGAADAVMTSGALLFALAGAWVFGRSKGAFADVL